MVNPRKMHVVFFSLSWLFVAIVVLVSWYTWLLDSASFEYSSTENTVYFNKPEEAKMAVALDFSCRFKETTQVSIKGTRVGKHPFSSPNEAMFYIKVDGKCSRHYWQLRLPFTNEELQVFIEKQLEDRLKLEAKPRVVRLTLPLHHAP